MSPLAGAFGAARGPGAGRPPFDVDLIYVESLDPQQEKVPASAQVGDIAVVIREDIDADATPTTPGTPAGYTSIASGSEAGTSFSVGWRIAYKIVESGDIDASIPGASSATDDYVFIIRATRDVAIAHVGSTGGIAESALSLSKAIDLTGASLPTFVFAFGNTEPISGGYSNFTLSGGQLFETGPDGAVGAAVFEANKTTITAEFTSNATADWITVVVCGISVTEA